MLKRTILVQNITNLSDARYFAAWGVDYMGFNRKKDSPYYIEEEQLMEMKEWVSGPQILIESNAIEYADNFDGQILDLAYASLPINKLCLFRTDIDTIVNEQREGKFIIPFATNLKEKLPSIPLNAEIFVEVNSAPLRNLMSIENIGLAVQGGEEEKVGFKDFDELDQLFDWLSDS